jgi:hypothetical protein
MTAVHFGSNYKFAQSNTGKSWVPHGTSDPIQIIIDRINVAKSIQQLLKTKDLDSMKQNGFQISGIRNQSIFDWLGKDPVERLLKRFNELTLLVRESCESLPRSLSKTQYWKLRQEFWNTVIEKWYTQKTNTRNIITYTGNTPKLIRELVWDTFKK